MISRISYVHTTNVMQSNYLFLGLGVRTNLLATRGGDNVDEASVVLKSLLSASSGSLLLLGLLLLGGLVSDLTGTGKRTVDLTTSQSENQVQGGLLLNVVVAASENKKEKMD